MEIVIETPRLLLRQFTSEDAADLYELNADPEVLRFTGDEAFDTIEEASNFIQNYTDYKENGFGRWAVKAKESGQFLGWCGLRRHSDGMVDLGFRFHQKHWGRGYATEAAKACMKYGWNDLGLKQIIGRAAKANTASIRVLEKLGMNYWKDAACDGIMDAVWYRIEH
jgi:[ribosomal protein S5]-alanine N-acetyltransferase